MKKITKVALALSLFVISPAFAQKDGKTQQSKPQTTTQQTAQKFDDKAMIDLATKKGCLACHQLENKMVGPSWKEVSKKYTDKDIDYLTNSILNGGVGRWGNIPMPAQKGIVTDAEAKQLALWIISLKNK